MTRAEIEKRIANERKLRNEGYSNREIAEIMGVAHYTVLNDIGKEPQELRQRRKEERKKAVASMQGDGEVYFPGSRMVEKKEAEEEEEPKTPFAEVWKKAERMHDVLEDGVPLTIPKATLQHRKQWLISDKVENAQRAWRRIIDGEGVLARQPEIINVSMWFDRENKPWLTIVYSEVCE